ncbi:hypothetical protein [Sulfurovum riftiae]|uniref:Lipoprotein n=1 Tax=Sulfurovum riftiae TaxID=1630136 RepID=A0A151CIU9_9BACT|nr:hypothetical protein [Sulfurovum riftiae]KYJ87193.1 hypothetical protein AS592_11885 [Sulfurovum riftiae]
MKHTVYKFIVILFLILLTGCGGGGSTGKTNTSTPIQNITLSGILKYERVPVNSNGIGLDYDHIFTNTIKLVKVEAIDAFGKVLASTFSEKTGNYSMEVPGNTKMKVRVYAQMKQSGIPGWDVKVLDNTDGDALYVMEGELSFTGTTDTIRNLTALSGWDSDGNNVSQRVAAPFAILDNIYDAMQKILLVKPDTSFPALQVHWSERNIPSSDFKPALGQIITSLYSGGNLYILGAKDLDTDEYDDHIITHEWGHYYEEKFSRADSIGGVHNNGDYLDIRVAFSEGFGNAFSAIALDEPRYFDSMGTGQSQGFSFNMESETKVNPGWYSEGSVQRILYDLYDAESDGADDLSMGFAPLHAVFTDTQKRTKAFTSLFTFITALKSGNSTEGTQIDSIVADESIAAIADIYGSGRTNLASESPYMTLTLPSGTVTTNTHYGDNHNNLGNHKYVKFAIDTAGSYTITIEDNENSNPSDPDFELYRTSPSFEFIDGLLGTAPRVESASFTLDAGEYLLDVSDWELTSDAEFTITID